MAKLELINVSKNFGNVEVLRNISFTTDEQDFVVFVGPSGCGKSTLLRVIAGLEDLSDGELVIDGQRVNDLTPKQRGIAMVFQSYALYPHMNVYQNMAFGLGLSRIGREKIDEKVREAAELLELDDLLDRLPKQLSGGQRQRVAIGRAIVRNPKLFLFDEPLSNLDAALRVQMRIEIAKLHARMPATMIYVTHDQVEAMTLASRIIVLSKGRIEQIGTPLEIYRHPANLFVAGFIGSPQMNFLPVQSQQAGGGYMRLELPGGRQIEIAFNEAGENLPNDGDLTLGIRAEHLEIASSETVEGGKYHLSGQIEVIEELGDSRLLHIRIQNDKMICFRSSDDDQGGRGADGLSGANYKVGDGIFLICPVRHCHLFDGSGQALGAVSS